MNAQIGRNENNKFCLHDTPNRNGELLAEFSFEIRLVGICLIPHLYGLGPSPRFNVGPHTSQSSWVGKNKNCVDPVGIPPQGGRLGRWAINPALPPKGQVMPGG